jgi:hypothetical protein
MMYEIKVVSQRNLSSEIGYKDIIIDRRSALGNPYEMDKTQTREMVVTAHKKYLWDCIKKAAIDPCQFPSLDTSLAIAPTFKLVEVGVVLSRLESIVFAKTNIRLLCWCNPLPCHGDTIKSCILWMRKQSPERLQPNPHQVSLS